MRDRERALMERREKMSDEIEERKHRKEGKYFIFSAKRKERVLREMG